MASSTSPLPVPPGATADSRTSSSPSEARRAPLPTRRRSSSSRHSSSTQPTSSAAAAAYVAAEEDDEEDYIRKIPLEPPSSAPLDEELEEILAARLSGEHSLGGWHYAPLIVGIGPALGAIVGGKADLWSDAILLLLSSFWLFQCLKIPNDIYHAARTRRILQDDEHAVDEGIPSDSPERRRRRQLAIADLQRTEIIALVACIVSPVLGAYALNWLQLSLHDGTRYLNRFNIRLFMMAAGIRPWLHFFKLIRRRTLLLQEDVHYPSAKVESMKRRINRLEADISALRKTSVSRTDVRMLRDGIDVPLSQMSRSMRRYERKEENLRTLADDKFSLVEARLEDLLRECAINAELIEAERLERERSSSLGKNILEAFKYALGQQRSSSTSLANRAYLIDGRSLSSSASFAGIAAPPGPGSPESSGGSGGMLSPDGARRRLPSSLSGREPLAEGSYASQQQHHRAASQPLPPRLQRSASAPEWYEQGVLYWAFLPLNVSNSVLRLAGEKLVGGNNKEASSTSASSGSVGSPADYASPTKSSGASLARRSSLSARAAAAAAAATGASSLLLPSSTPSSRTLGQYPSGSTMLLQQGEGSLSPPLHIPGGSGPGLSYTANGAALSSSSTSASPPDRSAFRNRERQQPSIHISTSPVAQDKGKYSHSAFVGNGNGNGAGTPLGQLNLNHSAGATSVNPPTSTTTASWKRSMSHQQQQQQQTQQQMGDRSTSAGLRGVKV